MMQGHNDEVPAMESGMKRMASSGLYPKVEKIVLQDISQSYLLKDFGIADELVAEDVARSISSP